MPVAAAPREAKLDRLAQGQAFQPSLRLLDKRPRRVAAPAERRSRRLRADQADRTAVGEAERLAVEDRGDRARLETADVAGCIRRHHADQGTGRDEKRESQPNQGDPLRYAR
ncbi:MAG: hypothetical protein R6X03_11935 [Methyloceanibacter sp.]